MNPDVQLLEGSPNVAKSLKVTCGPLGTLGQLLDPDGQLLEGYPKVAKNLKIIFGPLGTFG